LLYPFRQAFYARLGYAPVSRYRVLTASPRAIPANWKEASPGIIRCLRAGDRAELDRVYRDAARHRTGALDRPERAWELDLLDERRQWLVLDQDGAVAGYATFPCSRPSLTPGSAPRSMNSWRPRMAHAAVSSPPWAGLAIRFGDLVVALAEDDPMDWGFVDGDRDRGGTRMWSIRWGVFAPVP